MFFYIFFENFNLKCVTKTVLIIHDFFRILYDIRKKKKRVRSVPSKKNLKILMNSLITYHSVSRKSHSTL